MKKLLLVILLLAGSPVYAATCKISEYVGIRDNIQAPQEPPVARQNVTYTTSTATSVFNGSTKLIGVICDAKAHYAIGADPATTLNDSATFPFIPANTLTYFAVFGGRDAIAFYDGTS